MAFVVEDGTGRADANALASVEFCDAYHSEVGTPASEWADLVTSRKQRNIIVATQYVEASNADNWKGYRSTFAQALSNPRAGVYVDGQLQLHNAVHLNLRKATAILAHRAETQDLLPDLAASGAATATRIKLGPMEKSVEYAGGNPPHRSFELAAALLAPLLESQTEVEVGRFL